VRHRRALIKVWRSPKGHLAKDSIHRNRYQQVAYKSSEWVWLFWWHHGVMAHIRALGLKHGMALGFGDAL